MSQSEARVIETESGKKVQMSYKQGCRDYTIGFATAQFMITTLCGFVFLYDSFLPSYLVYATVPLFFVFSIIGWVSMAAAYTYPVKFYEFMEKDSWLEKITSSNNN